MNKVTCPKCRKETGFLTFEADTPFYCNNCGSKLVISVRVIEAKQPSYPETYDEDDLLEQAVLICVEAGNASVSILQRRLGVGYPRAARLIDALEQKGFIGPFEGAKPRAILISKADCIRMFHK